MPASRHPSVNAVRPVVAGLLWGALGLTLNGCGTTQQATATDQMVASDAVDRSISQIDFTPLTGQKVYLDTSYIQNPKTPVGIGFVTPEYVISGIRQQMMAAGLELMETRDQADFIVEARLGVLGIAVGKSSAHDYWLFGAGPFQSGDIHKGVQLAGNPVRVPLSSNEQPNSSGPISAHRQTMIFEGIEAAKKPEPTIQQASGETPAEGVK